MASYKGLEVSVTRMKDSLDVPDIFFLGRRWADGGGFLLTRLDTSSELMFEALLA